MLGKCEPYRGGVQKAYVYVFFCSLHDAHRPQRRPLGDAPKHSLDAAMVCRIGAVCQVQQPRKPSMNANQERSTSSTTI
eukprot:4972949-Amphidinium_carterae.1